MFLQYKVITRIPYFVTSKGQLTSSEVAVGKQIGRARIHVERVIGPLEILVTRSYFTIQSS